MTNGQAIGSLRPVRLLGRGGMGEVWLCRDDALGVDRAVKFLLPERAGDDALRARFAAEARILASFGEAPGVVRVHAAGEDPATRRPFFVMDAHLLPPERIRDICTRRLGLPAAAADAIVHAEFAEGRAAGGGSGEAEPPPVESRAESSEAPFTLQSALGDEAAGTARQLPERAVLSLAREIAAALARLHARKPPVVHRDIKPSNLLFAADGRLLLADFGVAKTLDPARTGLTRTGAQPGTQRYAAPELLRGDPATPAADWYALGVVLFRALTSSFPQWGEAFPTRAGLRPFSPLWVPLLRDLLASDPAHRLADAAAFARRLDTLERSLDTRGRLPRRARRIALAAAAAAVVVIAGAATLLRHAESAAGPAGLASFPHAESAGFAESISHAEPIPAAAPAGPASFPHAESAEVGGGSGEGKPPPVEPRTSEPANLRPANFDDSVTISDVYSEARFPGQPARRARIASGMPRELDTSNYPDGAGPPPQAIDSEPIREFLPDLEHVVGVLVPEATNRNPAVAAEWQIGANQFREAYARAMLESAESFRKRAEAGEEIPDADFSRAHFSREHWEAWLARKRAEEAADRKISPASPESGAEDSSP